jgi:hypothetical protein
MINKSQNLSTYPKAIPRNVQTCAQEASAERLSILSSTLEDGVSGCVSHTANVGTCVRSGQFDALWSGKGPQGAPMHQRSVVKWEGEKHPMSWTHGPMDHV